MEGSQDSSTSSKPAEDADGDAGSAGSHTTLGAGSGDGGGSQEREELSQVYEEMETASVRDRPNRGVPRLVAFMGVSSERESIGQLVMGSMDADATPPARPSFPIPLRPRAQVSSRTTRPALDATESRPCVRTMKGAGALVPVRFRPP